MSYRKTLSIVALAVALPLGYAQAETKPATDAAAVTLKAPAGVYVIDPTHASLHWSVVHNKISNYTGRFNKVEGSLTLDPADLSKSSVEIKLDPTTVDVNYPADYKATHAKTGFASWSEDIARNKNYLNADKFPQATFKSTKVTVTGPRTATVAGDLTLLGVTKPVTLDATFTGELEKHPFAQRPALGFKVTGSFKRSDFGMPIGFVGDDVSLLFNGELIKAAK